MIDFYFLALFGFFLVLFIQKCDSAMDVLVQLRSAEVFNNEGGRELAVQLTIPESNNGTQQVILEHIEGNLTCGSIGNATLWGCRNPLGNANKYVFGGFATQFVILSAIVFLFICIEYLIDLCMYVCACAWRSMCERSCAQLVLAEMDGGTAQQFGAHEFCNT